MDEHRRQKQLESKQHCSEKQVHSEEVQNVISCAKTSTKSAAGRDSVDKKVLCFISDFTDKIHIQNRTKCHTNLYIGMALGLPADGNTQFCDLNY